MKASTVGGVVGGLVLGAAIGWFVASPGAADDPGDGDGAAAEAPALTKAREEAARLERELREARSEARTAERNLKEVRKELDEAQKALVAAAPDGEAEPASESVADTPAWHARVKSFPTFEKGAYDGALEDIDWISVGGNMSSMLKLLPELAEAMQKGEMPPPEVLGKIQQHNGPLVTVALRLDQAGVPGTGPNGSFTNPAFMANAIAATLEAHGLPLSAEQSSALAKLDADFIRREDQRRGGYGDDALQLTKICDESDLKRDFFHAVFEMLTPEQGDALSPESVRGRTSIDLFNEGLMWAGRAGPQSFADRTALTSRIGDMVLQRFRLPVELHEGARLQVSQWVDTVPQTLLDTELDPLSENGMMMSDQVVQSGRLLARLFETLLRNLDMDDETAGRIRGFGQTVVIFGPKPDSG